MSKHLKTYIGGQVKTLRKQSRLTQAELGEKIGRTAEAISNVEEPTFARYTDRNVGIVGCATGQLLSDWRD